MVDIFCHTLSICKTARSEARVLDISVFMSTMHIHSGLCSLGASPVPHTRVPWWSWEGFLGIVRWGWLKWVVGGSFNTSRGGSKATTILCSCRIHPPYLVPPSFLLLRATHLKSVKLVRCVAGKRPQEHKHIYLSICDFKMTRRSALTALLLSSEDRVSWQGEGSGRALRRLA